MLYCLRELMTDTQETFTHSLTSSQSFLGEKNGFTAQKSFMTAKTSRNAE